MVHHYSRGLLATTVAILLLALSATVAVAADPTVTITAAIWATVPNPPEDFTITQLSATSINITWDMGAAANSTIIRGSTSGYPWLVTDGTPIYSSNGTYVVVEALELSTYTYYFRAWSQNDYGTSTGYAQASIGTATEDTGALAALLIGLIEGPTGIVNMMFAVALMGFAFWKKGWLRVLMATSLIIWGGFTMPYDMKIAAPFLGVGTLLFVMGMFQAITVYRESRETRSEARWAH